MAAYHCVDIPFAFDLLTAPGVSAALGECPPQSLADEVHGAWIRFIKDLDPGPSWPPYTLPDRVERRWAAVSALVHSTDHV